MRLSVGGAAGDRSLAMRLSFLVRRRSAAPRDVLTNLFAESMAGIAKSCVLEVAFCELATRAGKVADVICG